MTGISITFRKAGLAARMGRDTALAAGLAVLPWLVMPPGALAASKAEQRGSIIQKSVPSVAVPAAKTPVVQAPVVQAPVPAPPPTLKPDVTVSAEIITLGDLIAGLRPQDAAVAAFRAPALGETGTIQSNRIVATAEANGVPPVATRGLAQVVVTRAARNITSSDIENAVKQALSERHNVDGRALSLVFDGGAPKLVAEPGLTGELVAQDINYDPRARRVSATVLLPGSAAMRLKPARVSGQLIETVEVIVPLKTVARGELLTDQDVTIERRPRDGQTGDLVNEVAAAVGKMAKRQLAAGQPLRNSDIQRQEVIARGDLVTMVYEGPGVTLTLRGKATEAGAPGDTIAILNPTSKRVVQGVVTGPGRVSVGNAGGAASTGRVAAIP